MNLDNLIPVKEVAQLLKASELLVRQLVENKRLPGYSTENQNRRTFKIPRLAFYKAQGWDTEEEIKKAYKIAGIELKEKAVATNND